MVAALDHGLWGQTAPPAPVTSELAADIAADVVIVGAGFTGLSAALRLAEAGLKPVVLEAHHIGFGGSGRNVGLVNAGMWVMPANIPTILGPVYGERILGELGDAPSLVFDLIDRLGISCEAVRNGTLHCAVGSKGDAEIRLRASQWQARGADVEVIDARQTERMTGSQGYQSALLDRRCGTVQPLAYARGLASAAVRNGATIYTDTPVVSRSDLGDQWLVKSRSGSVTAPWLLLATNAYSVGAAAGIKAELVGMPYFNLATAPLGARLLQSILPEKQGVWDTRQILSSFRLDASGRLIFGSIGALTGTGRAIHRAWARRALARLFPELGSAVFEHEWFGRIGMTGNALPRLHCHGPRCYSISGYNGRGIAPGTCFGRNLAQLILGEVDVPDLPLPLTDMTRASFGAAHELYYEFGAQIAHLTALRLPPTKTGK